MRAALASAALAAAALVAAACTPAPPPPPAALEMDSSVDVDADDETTPLVCPGARGCERTDGALRAGAAFRSITPSFDAPVYIAGFSIGRAATGVHDDVEARAFVVEQGDLSVGFVTVDTVGWFQQDAQRVRARARSRGLTLDHIVVSSTHNHESKDTMGIWGASVSESGYDEAYNDFIADQCADALADAVAALHDVVLTTVQADASALVNDTRVPLVQDPNITLLHFTAVDDAEADVSWVVWGSHPETLDSENTLITADYPRFLREEVERLLPGTTAIFTSGVLGGLTTTIGLDLCVGDDGVDACPQGTFARAEEVGRRAAAIAVDALLAAPAPTRAKTATTLALRRLPVRVTPTNAPLIFAFGLGLLPRTVYDTGGGRVPDEDVPLLAIADMQRGLYQLSSEVDAITLGDAEIVTVPGEIYAELWVTGPDGESLVDAPAGGDFVEDGAGPVETPIQQTMAALSPSSSTRKKVILNQTNDSIGYIIPQTQWDIDAPYAYGGSQYGEQNSAGPSAAFEVTDGVRRLYELTVR